jgi:hypothetical protein
MNANNPNSVALTPSGTTLGASATDTLVSKEFRITAGGATNLRTDIYVGKVTVAAAVSAKFQHSSGYNIWTDAKTVSITASTDKTVSAVSTSLDQLTVTTHGFSTNTAIVFTSSGVVPTPLLAGKLYFAIVVNANTIQVAESKDGPAIDITDAGSGTITVCAARSFSITYQTTVSGDQTHLPLKSAGRVVATTGAGDSLQVSDVVILMDD